jgi:hypothetical protein
VLQLLGDQLALNTRVLGDGERSAQVGVLDDEIDWNVGLNMLW